MLSLFLSWLVLSGGNTFYYSLKKIWLCRPFPLYNCFLFHWCTDVSQCPAQSGHPDLLCPNSLFRRWTTSKQTQLCSQLPLAHSFPRAPAPKLACLWAGRDMSESLGVKLRRSCFPATCNLLTHVDSMSSRPPVCHPGPPLHQPGLSLEQISWQKTVHVKSSGTQGRTSQGPTRPSVYAYVHWNETMKTTNLLDDLSWPRSQCTERQGVCEAVYWEAGSPGRLLSLQSRPALLVPQRARDNPLCVHSSRPPDPASSLLSSGPPAFLRHWATPLPDMLRVNPSHGQPGARHPRWAVLLPASVPPPAPGSLPWFQVQAHLRVLSLFEAPGLLCKPSTLPSHRLYLYLLSPPASSK